MIKAIIVVALLVYAGWLFWRARSFAKMEFIDPAWGCERQRDYLYRRRAIRYHDGSACFIIALAIVVLNTKI
jgi:hypothetical protein